jgi:hypothetical protein
MYIVGEYYYLVEEGEGRFVICKTLDEAKEIGSRWAERDDDAHLAIINGNGELITEGYQHFVWHNENPYKLAWLKD